MSAVQPSRVEMSVPGIVVRTLPYGEGDLIVRFITPHGKIAVMAKEARRSKKRFPSGLDLLDRGTITFRMGRGSLATLVGFKPTASLRHVREQLSKLMAASLLTEAFDQCILEETDNEQFVHLFEALDLALNAVDESKNLKETLKPCCLALGALLEWRGVRPPDSEVPSAKILQRLLSAVESVIEKPLASRPQIEALLSELKNSTN